MISTGTTNDLDNGRAVFAFVLTPLLWPAAFWAGYEGLSEDIMDPLLWTQPINLYLPAVVWLGLSLVVTVAAARWFRLKRTNGLYLALSAFLAVILPPAIGTRVTWQTVVFCLSVAFITGAVFIGLGGLRAWKRGQT